MRITTAIILLIIGFKGFSQDTIKKSNPILFGELTLGYGGSFGEYNGFLYGGNGNFQFGKNLITIRYTVNPQFKFKPVVVGTVGIPGIESKFRNTERAILFGRRFINNNRSLSFAAGVSANDFQTKSIDEDGQKSSTSSQHYGMAYEFNVKWFNPVKKPYRIYMVIPVGKPTAFGRSFGFKLLGNISKHSYMGMAMTYGFGWHKAY